jgi:hypothetical protein
MASMLYSTHPQSLSSGAQMAMTNLAILLIPMTLMFSGFQPLAVFSSDLPGM